MGIINDSILWAKEKISSQGYILNDTPKNIQITPWSCVTRFSTSAGNLYLKQTPSTLSLEPRIIKFLQDTCHANVPTVMDINQDLHCFLMKDAGTPLRDFLKKQFQLELLCQAIQQYSAIQYASVIHIEFFHKLGIPDWGIEKFPTLYKRLIFENNILREDGLNSNELIVLEHLTSTLESICNNLIKHKIPQTLDNGDFHDNNILIEKINYHMTIIDWGEAVITHPFFSTIKCLKQAKIQHNISENAYLKLQDSCLDTWIKIENKRKLLEAFMLAKTLWPLYSAFGEYRLMLSTDSEEFKSLGRQGRLTKNLREFIQLTHTKQ